MNVPVVVFQVPVQPAPPVAAQYFVPRSQAPAAACAMPQHHVLMHNRSAPAVQTLYIPQAVPQAVHHVTAPVQHPSAAPVPAAPPAKAKPLAVGSVNAGKASKVKGLPKVGKSGEQRSGTSAVRDMDWICPKCSNVNWPTRMWCKRCRMMRPKAHRNGAKKERKAAVAPILVQECCVESSLASSEASLPHSNMDDDLHQLEFSTPPPLVDLDTSEEDLLGLLLPIVNGKLV